MTEKIIESDGRLFALHATFSVPTFESEAVAAIRAEERARQRSIPAKLDPLLATHYAAEDLLAKAKPLEAAGVDAAALEAALPGAADARNDLLPDGELQRLEQEQAAKPPIIAAVTEDIDGGKAVYVELPGMERVECPQCKTKHIKAKGAKP